MLNQTFFWKAVMLRGSDEKTISPPAMAQIENSAPPSFRHAHRSRRLSMSLKGAATAHRGHGESPVRNLLHAPEMYSVSVCPGHRCPGGLVSVHGRASG